MRIQEFVFLYENGAVKMVKVKTGIQDNTYIEIIEGLKEKDEIVVTLQGYIKRTEGWRQGEEGGNWSVA